MGLLDNALRGMAKTLVTTLGASATYKRRVPGAYDLVSGVEGPPTDSSVSVKIAPPAQYRREEIDWTAPAGRFDAILRDDFRVTLAASGFTLAPPNPSTDSILFNGTTFKIITSKPIYSGDQVAAFELQCRK